MNADIIYQVMLDPPIVAPALNEDASRNNPRGSRIGIFGMIFINIIDNVVGYISVGGACIAIYSDVCRLSLIREQTVLTFLMIVDNVIPNSDSHATGGSLDTCCPSATIGFPSTACVLKRVLLDCNVLGLSKMNIALSVVAKCVAAYQGILDEDMVVLTGIMAWA
jgi:hypothetical protein